MGDISLNSEHSRSWPDGLKVLGFVALLNGFLFGFFLTTATVFYEVDDDLLMQFISSGVFGGQPSEHLVFTNVLIGWVLRILYTTWSGWNWYLAYLLAVHYASMTAVAFVILNHRRSGSIVLLYTAFFILVESHILLTPQFTTTAFLAGTAGVLLLVEGMRPSRPVHWPTTISGLGFIGLMGMIREPVVPFLALVAFPFIVERFGLAGWRRLMFPGLLCAGLLLATSAVDRLYYNLDPAWAESREFITILGKIETTSLKFSVPKAASVVGWSDNDARLFGRWYFADTQVFGPSSKMHSLLQTLQTLPRPNPILWKSVVPYFNLSRALGSDAGLMIKLAALNAICCVVLAGPQRWRILATLVAFYGLSVLLTFFLRTAAHLPQRVAYNIPFFLQTMCLYWASRFPALSLTKNPQFRPRLLGFLSTSRFLRIVSLCVISLWAVLCAPLAIKVAEGLWYTNASAFYQRQQMNHQMSSLLEKWLPFREKPVVVPVVSDGPLVESLFFANPEMIPFSLLPFSWLSQSPIHQRVLNQHGLHPYSLSLLDRPDVLFLADPSSVGLLQTFYREHYDREIWFESVLDTDKVPEYTDCHIQFYRAHAVASANAQAASTQAGIHADFSVPAENPSNATAQ